MHRVGYALLILLASCGPVTSHYVQVNNQLVQGNYTEADRLIAKNQEDYGQRNAVLYYLDRAMTLHLAGQFAESNQFLEKADRRIEELYTKSVTAESGAMLTNDNTLPYEGEDFEKVMINLIGALNYVYLGQLSEALVEVRRLDHKLNVINDRYREKNVYREDAFARYMSGILFEAQGELNEAFIAYRKAYEIYREYQKEYQTPMPPNLPMDLLRITKSIGLLEEHDEYRQAFPNTQWIPQKEFQQSGELVFISYDGLAPIKEDFFIDAPIPDGEGGIYTLRVALPKFVARPTDVAYAEVHLLGPQGVVAAQRTFPVEDITAIAKKNLEDRIGRITAKAIARATAKYLAARKVRERTERDSVARILTELGTNLYTLVSEQSDKRSWRTLPDQFRMARLAAPEGTYTVSIEYYSVDQRMILKKSRELTLRSGQKVFMSHRMLGSPKMVRSRHARN